MAGVALEDGHACDANFLKGERKGGPTNSSSDNRDVDIDDAAAAKGHDPLRFKSCDQKDQVMSLNSEVHFTL